MKFILALCVVLLIFSLVACTAGDMTPNTPATTTELFVVPSPENSPGSAFVWEPPSGEGSTKLELPEFPGIIFSNELYQIPTEHGGFSWQRYVQTTSHDQHTKLFDFGLGPSVVFIADISGDGYPDFVYMTSWTSGLFTLGVRMYDYRNNTHHALRGYGDINGLAIAENGRLMVTRPCDETGELAPVGELVMVNGELMIAGLTQNHESFW